ncbi:MAG: BioY family transporter [Candidatus Pelagibacter sp. TMED275]|nr:MAG: BioY family transporter [Candidatus Pelagibacter sp. TMED275]|tara:strand:+ start:578 stop:1126 length:549 start_codon:yes stop_codon:yes gene_type:complete
MEKILKKNPTKILKSLFLVIFGSLILTLSAKIQTPYAPVPSTMQTFAVLLLGMSLGYKLASITVIVYLIEGMLGMPVFAKGGGIIYLTGPTSGYLIGFIFASFAAGFLKKDNNYFYVFFYLLFSVSIIYFIGLLWLWNFIGIEKSFVDIFNIGVKPFLLIEFYKLLMLTILSSQIFKLRKFI